MSCTVCLDTHTIWQSMTSPRSRYPPPFTSSVKTSSSSIHGAHHMTLNTRSRERKTSFTPLASPPQEVKRLTTLPAGSGRLTSSWSQSGRAVLSAHQSDICPSLEGRVVLTKQWDRRMLIDIYVHNTISPMNIIFYIFSGVDFKLAAWASGMHTIFRQ